MESALTKMEINGYTLQLKAKRCLKNCTPDDANVINYYIHRTMLY